MAHPVAAVISVPGANQHGEVTVINEGNSGDGTFLDACSGSINEPPNTTLQCIVVKNYPSKPSNFPTSAEDAFQFVSQSGDCITIDASQVTSSGTWSCNGLLSAALPSNPAVCVNNTGAPIVPPAAPNCVNFLVAVAYYMGNSGGTADQYELDARFWYPIDNARPAKKGKYKRSLAKPSSAIDGVQPIAVDGQWFVYRVDVASSDGTRLMLGDEPLRARLLQIAAPRVHWKPESKEPTVVRTPFGIGCHHPQDGRFNMRHSGFAWYAPIAFQRVGPNVLCRYAVHSACTNVPDLIDLDSDLDILLGVNDRFGGFSNNSGIVEICVRVVA